jgi:acetylornithine/N-succinyldiaminopimelate aminotransferase
MSFGAHLGVLPDILCLAKGVAMGTPVGVTLARGNLDFTLGSHYSTFGGGPLALSMLDAFLDWSANEVNTSCAGFILEANLRAQSWARNVRGDGLMWAFDWDGCTLELANRALEREQLIIGAFRSGPGVVKLTPPLNISTEYMREGIEKLSRVARGV